MNGKNYNISETICHQARQHRQGITGKISRPSCGLCDSHSDKSRRFISQEVCRKWGWRQPNGVLKDMVCRSLLLLLESNGFIKLPPRKCTPPNPLANRKKPTRIIDRSDVDIFAYVLMGNHYHILLRTNQANLSKSMPTDQRRNRALVWHDLFGSKPHFKFHANQHAKRF
jgi:hypothetical protein